MAASNDEVIRIVLKMKDELSKIMKKAGVQTVADLKKIETGLNKLDKNFKKTAREAKKAGFSISKAMKGAGASLLGLVGAFTLVTIAVTAFVAIWKLLRAGLRLARRAMIASTRAAAAFTIAMAEVSTILPEANRQMVGLAREVKNLSIELNKPALDVAKGLYQAISAGFSDAKDAMTLLTQAARLGTAGLADTASTIDLLTTTINAYRHEVSDAERISDIFFETVRLGKTTISELSTSVGKALPLAASLGITIEEVAAGMATLTQEGFNTGEAMTAMRALFKALLRQVGQLNLVFNKTGQEYTLQTVRANGLAETLRILRASVTDDSEAMLVLGGRVEAAGALFGLTGKNLKAFQRILEGIEGSAGATDLALQKMLENDAVFLQRGLKAIQIETLAFGEALLEGMADALRDFGGIEELQGQLRANFEAIKPLVSAVAKSISEMALSLADFATEVEVVQKSLEVWADTIKLIAEAYASLTGGTGLERSVDRVNDLRDSLKQLRIDKSAAVQAAIDFDDSDLIELTKRLAGVTKNLYEQFIEDRPDVSLLLDSDAFVKEAMDIASRISEVMAADTDWIGESDETKAALRGLGLELFDLIQDVDEATVESIKSELELVQVLGKQAAVRELNMALNSVALKAAEDRVTVAERMQAAVEKMFGPERVKEATAFWDAFTSGDALDKGQFTAMDFKDGFISGLVNDREATAAAFDDLISLSIPGSRKTIEQGALELADLFNRTLGRSMRNAFDGVFDDLPLKPAVIDFFTRTNEDAAADQADNAAKLAAIKEQQNAQEFILKIKGRQRRKNAELIQDARDQLAVDLRLLDVATGRDKKPIGAEALLPGKAELLRVMLDNLRSIGTATIDLPTAFGITIPVEYESNPEAFRKLVAEFPELKIKITPVVDRTGIMKSLLDIQQDTALSISEQVALQKELNALQADAANLKPFAVNALPEDKAARALAIEDRKALADLDATLEGRRKNLEVTRNQLELSLGINQSVASRKRLTSDVAITEAELADLEEFRATFAETANKALAERNALLAREGVLVQADLAVQKKSQQVAVEVAQLGVAEAAGPLASLAAREKLLEALAAQKRAQLELLGLAEEHILAILKQFKAQEDVMTRWKHSLDTLGRDIAATFESSLGNLFGDLIDQTKSAKEAFEDFAKSFIKEVLRMIAVKATLALIGGFAKGGIIQGGTGDIKKLAKGGVIEGGTSEFTKFATGGVIDGGTSRFSKLPFVAAASGGVFSGPHMALIGEGKNDEAVVPLPDNKSIPVKFVDNKQGGSSPTEMRPMVVELNVQIPVQAIDTRDFRARIGEVSREIGDAVKKRIQEDPALLRALRSGVRR